MVITVYRCQFTNRGCCASFLPRAYDDACAHIPFLPCCSNRVVLPSIRVLGSEGNNQVLKDDAPCPLVTFMPTEAVHVHDLHAGRGRTCPLVTFMPTEEAEDPGDFCAFALQTLRIETACTANTNAGTSRMVK